MIESVAIVGTGLIGTSIGLALRRAGFDGEIVGVDAKGDEAAMAVSMGACDRVGAFDDVWKCDVVVLAVPVLTILDFLGRLAPLMGPDQLITDVGSTKLQIFEMVRSLRGNEVRVRMLPGHPMAGKESGGAELGDAGLFEGAMWLFTPAEEEWDVEREWREWVTRFGARTMDMDARRHDQVCAWVSHLPQMVATAMAAMYEDEFGAEPEIAAEFQAIGGRALREMTRLGASPYSMWRDVAMSNTEPLAATLFALEQRLQHLREGLRTPELREEFRLANAFRARK
ncbi:prephenate dehydrogenase [Granulicella tundricola]|uniref:Prephenate dehydrogenase n=1 Tax=Granulicella tundricola (strain ATCC BAA-1859 / DSM 23138 / MP5ACTX9) TaxID=1198114 RepID=E8WZS7_GRATM|nr:prephenate dehydrogenase [Granulicella tundricola]ADW67738.1 Prephenate dehydrogenase [Granulicella tundricola MP5ACTX9]